MNILSSFRNTIFAFVLRIVREHMITVGMGVLALLFVGVLLFDGWVFYANIVQQREPAAAREKKINLSEKGVADVLILLDARQKKFDETLNGISQTDMPPLQ